MLKAGDSFGALKAIRQLGKGGMGEVWLLQNPTDGRFCAAKLMDYAASNDHESRKRFLREAQLAMGVKHPNLVEVYDIGQDPDTGLCYILMEYVPNGSLADMIASRGALPIEQAVSIVRSIASVLEAAAKKGIVHRDIKPANIMFAADGTPKLADLGIARATGDAGSQTTITQTGMMIGTPAYMSPEQMIDSHNVDIRADIYSLGVVFYEMLTGSRPNPHDTVIQLLAKAMKGEPLPDVRKVRPEVSASLAQLLNLMTDPDVKRRADSPTVVLRLLEAPQPDAAVTVNRIEQKQPTLNNIRPNTLAEMRDDFYGRKKLPAYCWYALVVVAIAAVVVVNVLRSSRPSGESVTKAQPAPVKEVPSAPVVEQVAPEPVEKQVAPEMVAKKPEPTSSQSTDLERYVQNTDGKWDFESDPNKYAIGSIELQWFDHDPTNETRKWNGKDCSSLGITNGVIAVNMLYEVCGCIPTCKNVWIVLRCGYSDRWDLSAVSAKTTRFCNMVEFSLPPAQVVWDLFEKYHFPLFAWNGSRVMTNSIDQAMALLAVRESMRRLGREDLAEERIKQLLDSGTMGVFPLVSGLLRDHRELLKSYFAARHNIATSPNIHSDAYFSNDDAAALLSVAMKKNMFPYLKSKGLEVDKSKAKLDFPGKANVASQVAGEERFAEVRGVKWGYRANDNGQAVITSVDLRGVTDVVIPDKLDGLSVVDIKAQMFKGNSSIKSVEIPGTIRKIPDRCFSFCDALESVILNKGTVAIGYQSFCQSRKISTINLPEGLESIGAEAFFICGALKPVKLPASIKEISPYAFVAPLNFRQIQVEVDEYQLSYFDTEGRYLRAFGRECGPRAVVPDSVRYVGYQAASYSRSTLTEIVMPGVRYLSHEAIYASSKVTDITISGKVKFWVDSSAPHRKGPPPPVTHITVVDEPPEWDMKKEFDKLETVTYYSAYANQWEPYRKSHPDLKYVEKKGRYE